MTYRVYLTKSANKDVEKLKAAGLSEKAKRLLHIIAENPFQNPPPYEKLIGNLSGFYSRRINLQHRLVYKIEENTEQLKNPAGEIYEGIICVKRMWTHYE